MKSLILSCLSIYHTIFSPLLRQLLGQQLMCRYSGSLSCSEYAYNSVKKYGVFVGLKMAMIRLLSCQPLSNHYAAR